MKNRGFTLVELLAVLVIFAIIAVITIPVVSNLVLNSSVKSELQSAKLYIDAVELTIM